MLSALCNISKVSLKKGGKAMGRSTLRPHIFWARHPIMMRTSRGQNEA